MPVSVTVTLAAVSAFESHTGQDYALCPETALKGIESSDTATYGSFPNLRPLVMTPSPRHLPRPVASPSFPLSPSCGLSQTLVNFLLDHN